MGYLPLRRGAPHASLQRRDARDLWPTSWRPWACPSRSPRTAADFTGDPRAQARGILYIGDVIHQANIDVDEKGTEAAAATAVGMDDDRRLRRQPVPRKVITLRLDHPFLFVLRDLETGAVLFMGRVVDPSVGR